MEEKKIAPAQLIKDRYIPIEDVPTVLNLDVEYVKGLIKDKKIRYAEFMKPNYHRRTCHVDPLEICKLLGINCDERGIPL